MTPLPGLFSFKVTPYLREIVDCLGIDSPVRKLTFMKGVQICATTGVLENAVGYYIAHVKSASLMMVTADSNMAKLRMELAITPMLQESGLLHLIKSNDEANTRKTGKTDKKIDWVGGGFLIPNGAQNPNAFRSIPIRIMLRDEIDAWPTSTADGDPLKLTEDRTAAYEGDRKILDISTPLIKGHSNIESQFLLGDQRYYFVSCVACCHSQILRWQRVSPEGVVSGICWDTKRDEAGKSTGELVPGSVRYLCEKCGHAHTNDDKTRLLAPENGAEWRPTATPVSPDHRSYHQSALYSPVGMQTWEALVRKWLEAWDVLNNRVRDHEKLQVFYNQVLGETYEIRGEKLHFEAISAHRRHVYRYGEIPNKWAAQYAGSAVLLLTCTVDVHKDKLSVSVFGWCRDRRALLIDYWDFEGDTEQLDTPETWGRLSDLVVGKSYTADDGKKYRIAVTLIDSGYRTDQVYGFSRRFANGVYAIKGQPFPAKGATRKEWSARVTSMGTTAYDITVDFYKDRWSAALKHGWDGQTMQPEGHFNAPTDATDPQLRQLTVEVKREKIEKLTGKRVGFEWHRPSGSANELWDLIVYANAALDILAHSVCLQYWKLESVNWPAFYDACEKQHPFFQPSPN